MLYLLFNTALRWTLFGMILQPNQMQEKIIYQFNESSDKRDWLIINDGVMGGVSTSSFFINTRNVGVFKGEVSTANYGGFASVRCATGKFKTEDFTKVRLKLKGDGKNYQFRLKHKNSDPESYIITFPTTGEWEEVIINLNEMFPSFRGQKLKSPNFDKSFFEQICFLIANKKNESFRIEISEIALVK